MLTQGWHSQIDPSCFLTLLNLSCQEKSGSRSTLAGLGAVPAVVCAAVSKVVCLSLASFSSPQPHFTWSPSLGLSWPASTLHSGSSPNSWCNYLSTDSRGQLRLPLGHLSVCGSVRCGSASPSLAGLIDSDLIRGGENVCVCVCVWSSVCKEGTFSLGIARPGKQQSGVRCATSCLAAHGHGSAAVADLRIWGLAWIYLEHSPFWQMMTKWQVRASQTIVTAFSLCVCVFECAAARGSPGESPPKTNSMTTAWGCARPHQSSLLNKGVACSYYYSTCACACVCLTDCSACKITVFLLLFLWSCPVFNLQLCCFISLSLSLSDAHIYKDAKNIL